MTLYQNTMIGLRYKRWTMPEAIAYFIKGVARELHLAPAFFLNLYTKTRISAFLRKWLKQDGDVSYFDICGAKFPDMSNDREKISIFCRIFEDTFLIPAYYHDNYHRSLMEILDKVMMEGPYGYTDGLFDITVKKDDIVIDVGAWIGDFSAYAVSKGATAYAFEPVQETFQWLCKTQSLNCSGGRIHPVQKGLGSSECEVNISIIENNSGANSMVITRCSDASERILVTTLDRFVAENRLERVDFIKADIEGAEREMLKGAANVLKTFAPKLAICTYHLPDDPEILEKIIKDANPAYTVVHLRHKLFAAVV